MTSIDFIIKELKKLHANFSNSNIRYEFCHFTKTHLVEITPLEFYNSNSYMEYELNLDDRFFELYPSEDLVFISDQSLSKISNPIFEIFREKVGGFRTDFTVLPTFSEFDDFYENEYHYLEDNNYALAS